MTNEVKLSAKCAIERIDLNNLGDILWHDEIGRMFCVKHRREECNQCYVDYSPMNRQVEIDLGIRKPPSEIQTLAEQHTMCMNGIKFLRQNMSHANMSHEMDENLAFHLEHLQKVEKRLEDLRSTGASNEISEALRASQLKAQDKQSEVAAVASAWSKQNPGKTKMEYGGDETQNLFEQVAAPPPSANLTHRDRLICDYCSKSHNEKIKLCSRCWCVAYCDKECQTKAWKGHKKVCKPKEPVVNPVTGKKEKKVDLPLTWEQLEAFQGITAKGKVCCM